MAPLVKISIRIDAALHDGHIAINGHAISCCGDRYVQWLAILIASGQFFPHSVNFHGDVGDSVPVSTSNANTGIDLRKITVERGVAVFPFLILWYKSSVKG